MKETHIIHQVIEWIEGQLEHPLNLKVIAIKSGYGKTQLQKKFKRVTGENVMSYIRQRRLCRAALMLTLTNTSIHDIAEKFSFYSSQSFASLFKKYFGLTPSRFRKGHVDCTRLLISPFLNKHKGVFFDVIDINDTYLHSRKMTLQINIVDNLSCEQASRNIYARIRNTFNTMKVDKANIYNLIDYHPSAKKQNVMNVKFSIGSRSLEFSPHGSTLQGGCYARAIYMGNWEGYVNFSRFVYAHILPEHKLVRRDGVDFEVFHFNEQYVDDASSLIMVEYCVPILPRATAA